jgi:hypothetical protein
MAEVDGSTRPFALLLAVANFDVKGRAALNLAFARVWPQQGDF